jgi:hypothetical protein
MILICNWAVFYRPASQIVQARVTPFSVEVKCLFISSDRSSSDASYYARTLRQQQIAHDQDQYVERPKKHNQLVLSRVGFGKVLVQLVVLSISRLVSKPKYLS